jgi:hypothetical protein
MKNRIIVIVAFFICILPSILGQPVGGDGGTGGEGGSDGGTYNIPALGDGSYDSNALRDYFNQQNCIGCVLERASSDINVQFRSNQLMHPVGGPLTISNFPSGTKFIAEQSGFRVVIPKGGELPNVDMGTNAIIIGENGGAVKFNSIEITGEFRLQGGNAVVQAGSSVDINGLRIDAGSKDVAVYFDGRQPREGESAISFNQDPTRVTLQGEVTFTHETENHLFKATPLNDGKIELSLRKDPVTGIDQYSVVVTGQSDKEWARISNGKFTEEYGRDLIKQVPQDLFSNGEKSAYAMVIYVRENDGSPALFDNEGFPLAIVQNGDSMEVAVTDLNGNLQLAEGGCLPITGGVIGITGNAPLCFKSTLGYCREKPAVPIEVVSLNRAQSKEMSELLATTYKQELQALSSSISEKCGDCKIRVTFSEPDLSRATAINVGASYNPNEKALDVWSIVSKDTNGRSLSPEKFDQNFRAALKEAANVQITQPSSPPKTVSTSAPSTTVPQRSIADLGNQIRNTVTGGQSKAVTEGQLNSGCMDDNTKCK